MAGYRRVDWTGVLTTGHVAAICRVAARTVTRWHVDGHLKGYHLPNRNVRRFRTEDVRRFMQRHGMLAEWLDEFIAKQGGAADAANETAAGVSAGVAGGDGVGDSDRGADTGAADDLRDGRECD